MNEDISKMNNDELEAIIRLHENPNTPGSRFQKAQTELGLRYQKLGYKPGLYFEVGGDMTMKGSEIHLSEDSVMSTQIRGDLVNEKTKIIQGSISKKKWFSMDNPFVYIPTILIISLITLLYLN